MKSIKIDKEAYLKAGFTYEEIERIGKAEQNILDGKILTKKEMNNFIDNELFSNYKINA